MTPHIRVCGSTVSNFARFLLLMAVVLCPASHQAENGIRRTNDNGDDYLSQWLTIFIFLLSPVNKRNSLFLLYIGGTGIFWVAIVIFQCEIVTMSVRKKKYKNSDEEPGLVPKLPHHQFDLVLWIFVQFPLALPEIEKLKTRVYCTAETKEFETISQQQVSGSKTLCLSRPSISFNSQTSWTIFSR